MNREKVAKYLDVSPSAVDRYALRGRLRTREIDDAGRPSYDEGDVRRLKDEMDSRVPRACAGDQKRPHRLTQ